MYVERERERERQRDEEEVEGGRRRTKTRKRNFHQSSLTLNLSSFFLRDEPRTEADPISKTRTGAEEVVAGEDEEAEATIVDVGLLDADLDESASVVAVVGRSVHARHAAEEEHARRAGAGAGAETTPERTTVEARIIIEGRRRTRRYRSKRR